MRQLTNALMEAREGTGQVREILLTASFKPRLPGLTKMVSKLSKEGAWRKALELFETVEELGVSPDTALTNSAISACDKGGRWQKALDIFEAMERSGGLHRDAITYSATISALAKGKHWHAALQVFNHMQAANIQADVVTCCSLINALERGGQWQLAETLFLEMCTIQGSSGGMITATDGSIEASPAGLGTFTGHVGMILRNQTSPVSVLGALELSGGGAVGGGINNKTIPATPGTGSTTSTATATPPGLMRSGPMKNPSEQEEEAAMRSLGILTSPSLSTQDEGISVIGGEERNKVNIDLSDAFNRAVDIHYNNNNNNKSGVGGGDQIQKTLSLSSAASSTTTTVAPPPPPPTHQGTILRRESATTGGAHVLHQAQGAQHLRRAMSCFPSLQQRPSSSSSSGLGGGGGDSLHEGTDTSSGGMALFNFSHAARVTPNRVCCNALLAAYARAKPPQWERAVKLLEAMWGGGPVLSPDAVSYNTAIKACSAALRLKESLDLYTEMQGKGVPPNLTTFNSLISAMSEAGHAELLMQVGIYLDHSPLDVRIACSNAYIGGLVKVDRWEEAHHRFKSMLLPTSPVRPNAATFNSMMTGHLKDGNWQGVVTTFRAMINTGIAPSIVSFNTLLAAHAQVGAWEDSLRVLDAILTHHRHQSSASSSSNIGGGHHQHQHHNRGGSHHNNNTMEGGSVHPTASSFNMCLSAMATAAHTIPPANHPFLAEKALQVYHSMQSNAGLIPDAMTYTVLIKIMDVTGNVQQVVSLHDIMQSSGHCGTGTGGSPTGLVSALNSSSNNDAIDVQLTETVLNAAVETGNTQKAVLLAHSLLTQGITIDPNVLSAVMGVCIRLGAWEAGIKLSEAGWRLNSTGGRAMFNYMLEAALEAAQYETMLKILTKMQEHGLEAESIFTANLLMSPDSLNRGTISVSDTGGVATTSPLPTISSIGYVGHPQNLTSTSPSGGEGEGRGGAFNSCSPTGLGSFLLSASPPTTTMTGGGGLSRKKSKIITAGAAGIDPLLPTSTTTTTTTRTTATATAATNSSEGDMWLLASPRPSSGLSLAESVALLDHLRKQGDSEGALDVLSNMKTIGLKPNLEAYTAVIELMVHANHADAAVKLCAEAHRDGAMTVFSLPTTGSTTAGMKSLDLVLDSAVVDLSQIYTMEEVSIAAVASWFTELQALKRAKLLSPPSPSKDGDVVIAVKVVCGKGREGKKMLDSTMGMLTTGKCSVHAFNMYVNAVLPAEKISADRDRDRDGEFIAYIDAKALYDCL